MKFTYELVLNDVFLIAYCNFSEPNLDDLSFELFETESGDSRSDLNEQTKNVILADSQFVYSVLEKAGLLAESGYEDVNDYNKEHATY